MALVRYLLATLLLMYAGQSMALFMPEGYKADLDTDNTAESQSEGC